MKTLHVTGRVVSGKGKGAKFIKLPFVKKQITEKLDFIPFSGTLNIKLARNSPKYKEFLKTAKLTEITPAKGYCRGRCFPAYFMGSEKCAVVIPEIIGYPEDILEIIAPANLREKFHLNDGDNVTLTIMF